MNNYNNIEMLKKGILSLQTSRFGIICEKIIKRKYGFKNRKNKYYDLLDGNNKIEVKFSKVLPSKFIKINENNILDVIYESGEKELLSYNENISNIKFDCNIQQIKKNEFDYLFYGLVFNNGIYVFKIKNEDITAENVDYSNIQHKGNVGEGQFHITNQNINKHIKNYLIDIITFDEIYQLLLNAEGE